MDHLDAIQAFCKMEGMTECSMKHIGGDETWVVEESRFDGTNAGNPNQRVGGLERKVEDVEMQEKGADNGIGTARSPTGDRSPEKLHSLNATENDVRKEKEGDTHGVATDNEESPIKEGNQSLNEEGQGHVNMGDEVGHSAQSSAGKDGGCSGQTGGDKEMKVGLATEKGPEDNVELNNRMGPKKKKKGEINNTQHQFDKQVN
ncbi:hypothetical protein L6452_33914 [Arctium lappa]|uniref:Uncharacterized protein n=1 Tax=Arctium lappa TaxID=4217 RepID=A0ACB8YG08_ARCLA|nr:hypothetical protein L6452_33914 [Arctium lappa]